MTLPSSVWHGMIILSTLELLLQVSRLLPCQISISCHTLGLTHHCSVILSILKEKIFSSGIGAQWTSSDPLSSFPCQLLLSGLPCVAYLLAVWYVFCTTPGFMYSSVKLNLLHLKNSELGFIGYFAAESLTSRYSTQADVALYYLCFTAPFEREN